MSNTTTSPALKLDYSRVIPIFALTFVDILGLTIILPLLHIYALRFSASPLEIGLVAAAFPLSQLIGVPIMGALSDRFGRKPLLLISQITTCISFIMLGAANSLAMIVLSRVIDGIFGANIATAQAALSDITTPETRAQGLGLTGAAFGLGFILGPVISLLALEFTDNLALPAYIAAAYSFVSILLTQFTFKETLPPEKRRTRTLMGGLANVPRILTDPRINVLLLLMFAQQVVFFGFESLLGLFTLSRLGLLGQGNSIIFIVVGVLLVTVQVRYIGKWSRKYGERKLVYASLALLAVGLLLFAFTPAQPHPFYVKQIVQNRLFEEVKDGTTTSTEAIIGAINVPLPENGNNGIGGMLWVLVAIIPIAIGAGLIRANLNSLMTKRVGDGDYGGILGISAAVVSLANAVAPLLGGLIFQRFGVTEPFLWGGLMMVALFLLSLILVRPAENV